MQGQDSNPSKGLEQERKDEFKHEFKDMPRHERKMIRGFMRGFGKWLMRPGWTWTWSWD